jgi:hypothetical protein
VRCLTVTESACLVGIHTDWVLPRGSYAGIKAVGNCVPPPLAAAIMRAAMGGEVASAPTRKRGREESPTLTGLATRVAALEGRLAALEEA